MNQIFVPKGKLADDAALAAKRAELKRKLLEGGKITLKPNGSVTGGAGQDSSISVPIGKLADDISLAEKRAELKRKLLSGGKIELKPGAIIPGTPLKSSKVMRHTAEENNNISIPKGSLADDAALAAKRAELKRKLLEGGKITLKPNGSVTGGAGQDSSISVPIGKLAAQWYENDPKLLEMEIDAMGRSFRGFRLDKLNDGRLYWIGEVSPGIYETKFGVSRSYTLMAVYQNNHPHQQMGSSVFIYPVLPDVDEMIQEIGYTPHHLLRDSNGQKYLCTAREQDTKDGTTFTTAASVLAWAVKWLSCYELVLTGNMTREEFDS